MITNMEFSNLYTRLTFDSLTLARWMRSRFYFILNLSLGDGKVQGQWCWFSAETLAAVKLLILG